MIIIDKKRLVADIPKDLHDEFKLMAEKYNISMKDIIVDLLVQLLVQNREYDKEA